MEGSFISIFSKSLVSFQGDFLPNSHDLSEAQTQDGRAANVTLCAASAQGQSLGSEDPVARSPGKVSCFPVCGHESRQA